MFLRNNNDSFGLRRLEMARNRVDANQKSQSLDFHGSRGNSERGNDATMVEERRTDRYDRGNEGLVI